MNKPILDVSESLIEVSSTGQVMHLHLPEIMAKPAWADEEADCNTRSRDGAANIMYYGSAIKFANFEEYEDEITECTAEIIQDIFIRKDGVLEVYRPLVSVHSDDGLHLTSAQARELADVLVRLADIIDEVTA